MLSNNCRPPLRLSACLLYFAPQKHRPSQCSSNSPAPSPWPQARADDYTDGQRLLAEQNPTYEPELVELRGAARALALNFLQGGSRGDWGWAGLLGTRWDVEVGAVLVGLD